MTHILSLGAMNKTTGEYVYPKIANKQEDYVCRECVKAVVLCQGEIRVHYFRHKVDSINPCNHFSKPTESQIHKDAKLLYKYLMERKIQISFYRCCNRCNKNEEYEIPEMTEGSVIQLEHRFEYNGPKIADVAYLHDGEIVCLIEICNTHKTRSEDRPEPWFEIDAETLITIANDNSLTSLQIPCIRRETCDECIEKYKKIALAKEREEKARALAKEREEKARALEDEKEIALYGKTLAELEREKKKLEIALAKEREEKARAIEDEKEIALYGKTLAELEREKKKLKSRNKQRHMSYWIQNKENPHRIIVPFEYTGNIEGYPVLVNNFISEYIEKYEKNEKKQLFHMKNYYEAYKNALLNLYRCNSITKMSDYWNSRIIDIKQINKFLKKDNLMNPLTMVKHIGNLFKNLVCKECNIEGYCICNLDFREIRLLNNDECLICDYYGNHICRYCS